jgi:D-3-phosphoglycerate dehydrogenase / 2-oxoglutarate reductase
LELKVYHKDVSALIGATVLNGYGARIVTIKQYRIDIKPDKNLLFIKHHDMPGMIGKVGSLLGITR